MKFSVSQLLLCLLIPFSACSQKVSDELRYLGQEPPSSQPEIFAPDIISKTDQYEFGSVFNREATAFFYGVDTGDKSEIRYSELVGNKWSAPKTILSHNEYGFNDPFLSLDENRLYFISQKALAGKGSKQDYDIWYVERTGSHWSDPINAGSNINSVENEYYISFTKEGTMYFSSNKEVPGQANDNFDIYFSKNIEGEFQQAVRLGNSINTAHYEADVFISPDESYIIFCATRPEGLGRGDLYVSFKNSDGTWSKSMNMGDKINTKRHELCPFVSNDGKYLFYTSDQDIYWVSSNILSELKEKSGQR
ncbi:MAG: hypothetical protein AB8H12_20690 [Lewinella sp.]